MPTSFLKTKAVFYGLVGLLALHVALLLLRQEAIRRGEVDFAAFYGAGKIVHDAGGSGLYVIERQKEVQSALFPETVRERGGPLLFYHPPFEAALYAPLARLSYGSAYVVWGILSIALLCVLPFLLRPYLSGLAQQPARFLAISFLAFFPALLAVLQGQDSILLTLLFALTFVSLKQGRDIRAGCLLAAALFKFQFVLPIAALFLLRRRWKFVLGFSATAVVLAAASLAVVGMRGLIDYPALLWHLNSGLGTDAVQKVRTVVPRGMPNLRGFLFTSLNGLLPESVLKGLIAGCSLLLFGWWARRSSQCPPGRSPALDLVFSADVCLVLIIAFHSQLHDLVLLGLPILLVLNNLVENQDARRERAAGYEYLQGRPAGWRIGLVAAFFFATPLYLPLLALRLPCLLVAPLVLFFFGVAREFSLCARNSANEQRTAA